MRAVAIAVLLLAVGAAAQTPSSLVALLNNDAFKPFITKARVPVCGIGLQLIGGWRPVAAGGARPPPPPPLNRRSTARGRARLTSPPQAMSIPVCMSDPDNLAKFDMTKCQGLSSLMTDVFVSLLAWDWGGGDDRVPWLTNRTRCSAAALPSCSPMGASAPLPCPARHLMRQLPLDVHAAMLPTLVPPPLY